MEIHQSGFVDTLIRKFKCSGSIDGFKFDPKSISPLPERNPVGQSILDYPNSDSEFGPNSTNLVPSPGTSSEVDSPDGHDPMDAALKFISQMIMEEEDLQHKPCMFQDCLALQAAEKSLYDVIGEKYPPSLNDQHPLFVNRDADSPNGTFTSSSHSSNTFTAADNFIESDRLCDGDKFQTPFSRSSFVDYNFDSTLPSMGSYGPLDSDVPPYPYNDSLFISQYQRGDLKFAQLFHHNDHRDQDKVVVDARKDRRDDSANGSGGKRNLYIEDGDYLEGGRSNKQLAANYVEESDEQSDMYDQVLLCSKLNPHLHQSSKDDSWKNGANSQPKKSNGGRPRKKQGNKKEVIDLSALLTQCAQAVSSNDGRTANELLNRIRQHSSSNGDGTERLAHFLANALEHRLAGHGSGPFTSFTTRGISAADILKGYQVYLKACPFKKFSNFYANQFIARLAKTSTRLHVIDFGILYGFQWPCLIQLLSVRPGGPPKLTITGIDFPQPGLRPAERVEETGRRLAKYCERFKVPFEYYAIAKKWDAIQLEDIKIDKDDMLVVNCLHRLRYVPDDTVVFSNPRDTVLNLIKRIDPDLFVHGVVNGTYNAPFFLTRFREAFFHYSALFDMFDATVPREDKNRMLYEKEVFGKDAMNVIACEGTERVERPETYKQWQVRNIRAGFKQLPLNEEIVEIVKRRVTQFYHKDFVVDEDSKWMLQGWKGRIVCGISCWKPAKVL